MSSIAGAGAGDGQSSSYYPNAIYQEPIFSSQPPPFAVADDAAQASAPPTNAGAPRECSVRGCLNPVEPPSPNVLANKKMCAACREKHRAYASTKRARRKAEKTLVSRLSATTAGTGAHLQAVEPATWVDQESAGPGPAPPVAEYSPQISAPSTSSAPQSQPPAHWSHAIDPVLYSQPSGSSSSSTLAGALTLPPSTSAPLHQFSEGPSVAQPVSSSLVMDADPNARGSNNAQAGVGQIQGQIESATPVLPDVGTSALGAPQPAGAIGSVPQISDGRPRFCSVKGCKAIILESMEEYPYKMCQPCRNRYRLYGITKRAKWKAEREAYDKELEGLRAKEDLRRAATGLPPLADSPDELRAWELSVIDEQVPLPPSHQATSRESVPMPMDPLDTRYSHQVPADVPLPARMCTVSHCHKILPGFYRYKRCETHRIQNRWHSKLKRGREKIEKGFMLPDGTPIVVPAPVRPKKVREKKPRKKREAEGKEGAGAEGASGQGAAGEHGPTENEVGEAAPGENDERTDKPTQRRSKPPPKPSTTCREDDCNNLIMPGTRWRTCESCRALNRTLRQEQKTVVERVRSDGLAFVNMTVNNPDSGPNISASASGSGSSTDIVPIDISTSPGVASTYPLGYTSTSTLLTVNEPPAQAERANSGVRLVRKYKRLPRYDKDPNSTNAEASSSTARKPSASSTSQPPPPAYPYPPHGAFPYYMTPPGYYGMPPPPGSAAPGQPPLMYIPSPYPYPVMPPPPDRSGPPPSRTTPAPPFPYYPYTLPPPGYGMPQHYPRAHYAYPNPMPPAPQIAAGAQPTPYAVYKFHSTPQPAPPPSATPAQGYTYYQFKNGLNNPPEPPPRKRRRVSGETDVATQEQGEEQASRIPLSETPVAVPPADAPRPAEELAQPVTMDVDARDENVPVPAPAAAAQRVCGGKTCNRALVSGAPGPLCEKCRTKMKKRQAMTKQRFRLEPKKITATKSV